MTPIHDQRPDRPRHPLVAITLVLGLVLGLGIGLRAISAPEALMAGFGTVLGSTDATNEVRAQYGGFYLALGLVCGLGLRRRADPRLGLVALLMTVGGVLAGRIVSIAIDGADTASTFILLLLAADVVYVVLAALALRTLR